MPYFLADLQMRSGHRDQRRLAEMVTSRYLLVRELGVQQKGGCDFALYIQT